MRTRLDTVSMHVIELPHYLRYQLDIDGIILYKRDCFNVIWCTLRRCRWFYIDFCMLDWIVLGWVGDYLIAVIPWSSPVLPKDVTNIPGIHINSLVSNMGICSKCKILSPDVKDGECDDLLCETCDKIRLVTLAKERQQRQLHSSSLVSTHHIPDVEKDGITAQTQGSDGDSSISGDKLGVMAMMAAPAWYRTPTRGPRVRPVTIWPQPGGAGRRDGGDEITESTNRKALNRHSKKTEIKKQTNSNQYIDGCKVNGQQNWIQCWMCAHWYHMKCLKLSQDDISGVRPCDNCRHVAKDVGSLNDKFDKLFDIVDIHWGKQQGQGFSPNAIYPNWSRTLCT